MDYPKSARVLKRSEYLHFFNQSEVKRLPVCIIFKVSSSKPEARLGITVKSRTNSVKRNRVKRQVREAFRLNRKGFSAFDYNVVIPAHVKIDYLTPKKVRSNLEKLWSHANHF